jgi:beta-glucanase (GH16 family)
MFNIRRELSAGILITSVVMILSLATPLDAQIPDVPGWRLAWHDEFAGPDIDTDNWDLIDLQNSHNNEKQYYRPEQASIVDRTLRITATNQPLGNKQYRSARLESWQTFGPGRFEARIDLPTTQGMWPAFWLHPREVRWPTGGEIDILENRGSQPFIVSSAYHWQVDPDVPCCDQHQYVFEEYSTSENGQPVNFHNGFHIYAVEWEETELRFFVDGELHYTLRETDGRPIFETPKNILLNLAVGGHFGGDPDATTVFPQHMSVDYVRVWERQTGLAGDYNGDGTVNAADYVIWRNSDGENGIGLPADGSGNGSVGSEDYEIWKENFDGQLPASGDSSLQTVPEPSSAIPLTLSILFACTQRMVITAGRPIA